MVDYDGMSPRVLPILRKLAQGKRVTATQIKRDLQTLLYWRSIRVRLGKKTADIGKLKRLENNLEAIEAFFKSADMPTLVAFPSSDTLSTLEEATADALCDVSAALKEAAIRNKHGPRKQYALEIVRCAASIYKKYTGATPTLNYEESTNTHYSPFHSFVTDLFEALEIRASAAAMIKKWKASPAGKTNA